MDRFYKLPKTPFSNDLVIPVDSGNKSKSSVIDILDLTDISRKIDNVTLVVDPSTLLVKSTINTQSVKGVQFIDQDISYNRPPNTYPVVTALHLAADSNFLYIWSNDRWKRIPLSEF
jgi:hypothetical protein